MLLPMIVATDRYLFDSRPCLPVRATTSHAQLTTSVRTPRGHIWPRCVAVREPSAFATPLRKRRTARRAARLSSPAVRRPARAFTRLTTRKRAAYSRSTAQTRGPRCRVRSSPPAIAPTASASLWPLRRSRHGWADRCGRMGMRTWPRRSNAPRTIHRRTDCSPARASSTR